MNKEPEAKLSCTLSRAERAHLAVTGSGLGDVKICVLMRQNNTLMGSLANRLLEPFGLTIISYIVLISMRGTQGSHVNPSELCDTLGETRANMTRICDELVEKGLINRIPSPEDRRRVNLSLSDKGTELLNHIVPDLRVQVESLFSIFSEQEKATLISLLERMNKSFCELR
jgi:MarR family transcriptional repressor of emrRAB